MSDLSQPNSLPGAKLRLLLISDSPERLTQLRAELTTTGIEVATATFPEEIRSAERERYDLAVLDVSPTLLAGALQALREDLEYAHIPILVEAGRLSISHALAGVLPRYRAMPCSRADLIALTRRRSSHFSPRRFRRRML
jgi:hypothetical protein